ncbi:MAG: class I SAM-dependent methyltransferase [Anaerolineae bacterium]|nr:class I SAM-dependent methyltransferase [Anaerolineae bacterium]
MTDNSNHKIVEQYKTPGNLNARIALHQRFSTNHTPWHGWVFEHICAPGLLPANARILELGAGPGTLWEHNLDQIPPDWQVTLSDFSAGMVETQQKALDNNGHNFSFKVVDAQDIPFETATFDAVIANHMLYHVPDRAKALSEMQRVIKPGGKFFATTVGEMHMHEMWALLDTFIPGILKRAKSISNGFTLENGTQQLCEFFTGIERYNFEDSLIVTEAQPLIAYVHSSNTMMEGDKNAAQFAAYEQEVIRRIEEDGVIKITKASGIFTATRL